MASWNLKKEEENPSCFITITFATLAQASHYSFPVEFGEILSCTPSQVPLYFLFCCCLFKKKNSGCIDYLLLLPNKNLLSFTGN